MLALLVGPLLVLLVQLSLRRGTAAALAGAGGIWVSDLCFILLGHYGVGHVSQLLEHVRFAEIVGSAGALVLCGVAGAMWVRRPPDLGSGRHLPGRRGLAGAFLQGWAINTFNPFTVFFWAAFTVSQVHDRELPPAAAWAIYAGILSTIVVTDTLKVFLAKRLRNLLTPRTTRRVQRMGALALAVFGIALGVRVWWG